ncbi:MAG: hypothetical protein A3A88_00695 [Nitrospirae bacterium RIFCSPLOWO2_01_FULL_62_17]|nr:MAG: hypothetical protein A3A88_00695 [Nitrospirae bacterium RIFCSPLOWO2_01_FULL_62_17]
MGHHAPCDHRRKQKTDTEHRHFADPGRTKLFQINTHQESDGNRHGNRESAPGISIERVDDRQPETGQGDDDDEQDGHGRRRAGDDPQFIPRNLRQGPSVSPHRGHENDEVLHRAGQHRADHEPEKTRQIAELRRQHRTQQRPGAGDRREMMPEQHILVGGVKIGAVIEAAGRRHLLIVQSDDRARQKPAVKPERQHVETDGGHHQPQPVHFFVGIEEAGDESERDRAENRH